MANAFSNGNSYRVNVSQSSFHNKQFVYCITESSKYIEPNRVIRIIGWHFMISKSGDSSIVCFVCLMILLTETISSGRFGIAWNGGKLLSMRQSVSLFLCFSFLFLGVFLSIDFLLLLKPQGYKRRRSNNKKMKKTKSGKTTKIHKTYFSCTSKCTTADNDSKKKTHFFCSFYSSHRK